MMEETIELPKKITIDQTKIISIPDYAKKIGKSRQWVWKLVKTKEIESVRILNKNFILLE